jgi:hypothetical protein
MIPRRDCTSLQSEPALLKPGAKLQEEELAIRKTDKGDKAWYLVEVHKIYPDEIEVNNWTVTKPPLTNKSKKDFPNAAFGKPGSLDPVRMQAKEL